MSDATVNRRALVYRKWTREEFMRHMKRIESSPEYRKFRTEAEVEMDFLGLRMRPEKA